VVGEAANFGAVQPGHDWRTSAPAAFFEPDGGIDPRADDHRTAHDVATGAGALLLSIRARRARLDPAALRAEGDRSAHDFIVNALQTTLPGESVLSEEGKDDLRRLVADRVWIVDPLDGTREFAEPDRRDRAVHVALWAAGELVAGAGALPASEVTLSTAVQCEVGARAPGRLRLVVSRTRPPAVVESLRAELGTELVPMGSAGPRWRRSSRVRPMPTCMPTASTNGTLRPRSRARRPPACTHRASTGRRSTTTGPTRVLPDLVVCRAGVAADLPRRHIPVLLRAGSQ